MSVCPCGLLILPQHAHRPYVGQDVLRDGRLLGLGFGSPDEARLRILGGRTAGCAGIASDASSSSSSLMAEPPTGIGGDTSCSNLGEFSGLLVKESVLRLCFRSVTADLSVSFLSKAWWNVKRFRLLRGVLVVVVASSGLEDTCCTACSSILAVICDRCSSATTLPFSTDPGVARLCCTGD